MILHKKKFANSTPIGKNLKKGILHKFKVCKIVLLLKKQNENNDNDRNILLRLFFVDFNSKSPVIIP